MPGPAPSSRGRRPEWLSEAMAGGGISAGMPRAASGVASDPARQVEQRGARSLRVVGDVRTPVGEVPTPRVDRPDGDLATAGAMPRSLDVLLYHASFGAVKYESLLSQYGPGPGPSPRHRRDASVWCGIT
jgi:hypothetical protein